MSKIYIAVKSSWSSDGGDCIDCMYSSTDKYEICKKCIEHAVEELKSDFWGVAYLYTDYKVISVSDPEDFITDYMMKEEKVAETVATIMNLDRGIYEAIENREHAGYYIDKSDPEDILLRERIMNYMEDMIKGEENE